MANLTLLFIRHAEKPEEIWPGPGLTENGDSDSESLVIRGWQRTGAWAALFGSSWGGGDFPAPSTIFAATPGKTDKLDQGPSRRPYETIIPLAARLSLTPRLDFPKGNEKELVRTLLSLSGVVLVSWEHKAIVEDILPLLPIGEGNPPTTWPGERFDVVLRFDRVSETSSFTYRPLCPALLSGDARQIW